MANKVKNGKIATGDGRGGPCGSGFFRLAPASPDHCGLQAGGQSATSFATPASTHLRGSHASFSFSAVYFLLRPDVPQRIFRADSQKTGCPRGKLGSVAARFASRVAVHLPENPEEKGDRGKDGENQQSLQVKNEHGSLPRMDGGVHSPLQRGTARPRIDPSSTRFC